MTVSRPRQDGPRRRPQPPRAGVRRAYVGEGGAVNPIVTLGATYWYDSKDFTSSAVTAVNNRVGSGTAQRGSTAGSDTNDPTVVAGDYLDFDGTDDYMTLSHSYTFTETTGQLTVLVMFTPSVLSQVSCLFQSNGESSPGVFAWFLNADYRARLSSESTSASSMTVGTTMVAGLVVDNGFFKSYTSTLGAFGTNTAIPSARTHLSVQISSTVRPANINWYAYVEFPTALTLAECGTVSSFLMGRSYA